MLCFWTLSIVCFLNTMFPEIGSSIEWTRLSRFHLKTETGLSPRNVVFLNTKQNGVLDNTRLWIVSRNINLYKQNSYSSDVIDKMTRT
jgi:hypothetical protein